MLQPAGLSLTRTPILYAAIPSRTRSLILLLLLAAILSGCNATTSRTRDSASGGPVEVGLEGQLRLAEAALSGGDVDSAIRLYHAAVREHPREEQAQLGLANAYYAIRAYPEARVSYAQLAELAPTSPASHLGLGRVALATGDSEAAQQAFNAALHLAPQDTQAANGSAVAHDLAGDHAAAQTIYRQILKRDPANRAVANNLALSLALSGDLDTAAANLTDLAEGPAIMPEARHNLALVYALQGDATAAQKLIRRDLPPAALGETVAFYNRIAPPTGAKAD